MLKFLFHHLSPQISCSGQDRKSQEAIYKEKLLTEKPDIKTAYLLSIVLQKLFKMFAILFDTPSATFSYAIKNDGA
jgi:hypothetical protein